MSEIIRFLNTLWSERTQAGFLTLHKLHNNTSRHFSFSEFDAVASQAASWDAEGHDVYFGIGLRDAKLATQGGEAHVCALPGAFLDIDIRHPDAHAASTSLASSEEQVFDFLEGLPIEPTVVVHSGHGLHVYYLFEEPQIWKAGTEQQYNMKYFMKKFVGFMQAEGAKKGLQVDNVAKLSQILRLPGTHNYKTSVPKSVFLLSDDGPRHPFEKIKSLVVCSPGKRKKDSAIMNYGRKLFPFVPKGSPAWLVRLYADLSAKEDPVKRELVRAVLAGESFAEPGNRDNALRSATGLIAYHAFRVERTIEASDLIPLFENSLSVWAREPNAKLSLPEERHKAMRGLEAALTAVRRDDGIKRAQEADIRAGLARASGRKEREALQTRIEKLKEEQEPEPAPADDTVLNRFVIVKHTSCYMFHKGTYIGPYDRGTEFKLKCRQEWSDHPIIRLFEDTDEGPVEKSLNQILAEYATVANEVIYDSTIETSYFDPIENDLYIACSAMRKLEPRFHPEVDQWLRLLGGDRAEKLLDWLATLPILSKQTCALYLSGPKGTGKTLLAHSVSRLWRTHGGPTTLAHAVSNFNNDLLECPIIVADEEIPDHLTTGKLRELIGSSSRIIAKKFAHNSILNGAVRLMLLANNESLLARKEELTANDIDAIAQRFLHVQTPREAQEYLTSTDTSDWLDMDVVAKHLMWLISTRVVKPGKRFLVEGAETKMHRKLAMQVPTVKLTVEWLVRFLKGKPAGQNLSGIVVGDGKILVSATTLSQGWELFITSRKVPPTHLINDALKVLSDVDRCSVEGSSDELWNVKPEFLLDHAVELWGNGDFVLERLNAPRTTPKMGKVIPLEGTRKE